MLNLLNLQSEKYQKQKYKQNQNQKWYEPWLREGFDNHPDNDVLDEKFQSLVKDYENIQSQLATASGSYLDKLKSPYRNKFVSLPTGQKGYITGENVFKPLGQNFAIPGPTTGISSKVVDGLKTGTPLTSGESYFPAGQNIWVNQTIQPGSWPPEFLGCYQPDPNPENSSTPTNKDQCFQQAENQAYQYIGLGKIDQVNNIHCMLSNELKTFTQFGEMTNYDPVYLWSSGTQGTGNYAIFTQDGDLNVCNPNGDILFHRASPYPQCNQGGGINDVIATYGGNCSATAGNATQKVQETLGTSENANMIFPINNSVLGDPAPGCPKSWDTSYQCGNQPKTSHLDYGEGQNFLYDCTQNAQMCKQNMYIYLDGGAMRIQSPIDATQNTPLEWYTLNQTNPNWEASKGKTGTNKLYPTQALFVDEWIGNQDGSMRLMMRKEGDLVLMTSQLSKECKGTEVYQRPSTQLGYPELIRHMGYVDEDAILHEYPTELLTLGQNFQSFVQTTISGNDFMDENQPLTQISLEEMKQACLKQPDCGGFVYDPVNQQGWLKSKELSSANFQFSDTMTTYMRIPAVSTESPDCRNMPLSAVDSNIYALFPKGADMTSSTACGMAREIQPLRKQLKEISQQLNETAKQMKIQIDSVANRTEKHTGIFDQRTHTMALNLAKNAEIQQRIAQWHNDPQVEGFQQRPQQTQQDVRTQFQDANLLVNKMSDNYYLLVLGTFAIIGTGWWYFRKRHEILNNGGRK